LAEIAGLLNRDSREEIIVKSDQVQKWTEFKVTNAIDVAAWNDRTRTGNHPLYLSGDTTKLLYDRCQNFRDLINFHFVECVPERFARQARHNEAIANRIQYRQYGYRGVLLNNTDSFCLLGSLGASFRVYIA